MQYETIPLASSYNNKGFTYAEAPGNFTTFGSSYPGSELTSREDGREWIRGIPFLFPTRGQEFDNVEFASQKIIVPRCEYRAVFVLGAADNGSFSEDIRVTDGGVQKAEFKLSLSDWVAAEPIYGEYEAYRCSCIWSRKARIESIKPAIWMQSVHFEKPIVFDCIELPDNICMHVFSLTMEREDH